MEDISVCIQAYNEAKNLPRLFQSLKGLTDIIVYDHQSTDATAKLAKQMGARVYTHPLPHVIPEQKDIDEFLQRFGFYPTFKPNVPLPQWLGELNGIMEHAKHEWIFAPDCDEVVQWNLPAIRKMLPSWDLIGYTFVHEHNPDGTPKMVLPQHKLFRKSVNKWVSQCHSVIIGGQRVTFTNDMTLHHWQDKKVDQRASYLPRMEWAMMKEGDQRNTFYLARQYVYIGEWQRAIQFYMMYLTTATWRPEVCDAFLNIARCWWQLHEGEKARRSCLEAIARNPNFKEALIFMSEITATNDGKAWRRFADNANNDDVLFINKTYDIDIVEK